MNSSRKIVETLLQLLALAVLIGWCFKIIEPFITPLVWGCILAVAIFPFFKKLKKILKGKDLLAAAVITVTLLLLLILPAIFLGIKTGTEIKVLTTDYQQGQLIIPPAPENVKNWPIIGSKAFSIWQDASTNIELLIKHNPEFVSKAFDTTLSIVSNAGKGIVIFIVSIIISGVFLSYADSSEKYARLGFERLMGNIKSDMTMLAASTIRSVVKGIFGVTLIQSTLAAIGFFAAGIPGASLITLACFILGIMQIGMLPVTLSVIIYSWATMSFTKALIFTIWMALVGLSDNIIKPWILSKGAAVPMLVLFIGSLGGFIYSGFIGLFTGAVVFALGYKLFIAWIEGAEL